MEIPSLKDKVEKNGIYDEGCERKDADDRRAMVGIHRERLDVFQRLHTVIQILHCIFQVLIVVVGIVLIHCHDSRMFQMVYKN